MLIDVSQNQKKKKKEKGKEKKADLETITHKLLVFFRFISLSILYVKSHSIGSGNTSSITSLTSNNKDIIHTLLFAFYL